MEGRKPTASSSSSYSFTNELFGSKDSSSSSSSSSSSRIFGSIFSSPPKVLGRESLRSESMEKQHEPWNNKPGVPGDASKSSATESEGTPKKDFSSLYQEQRVQPCHLSSSIYYGGQDIYSQPQNSQGPGINSVLKKDGEDDSGSASRGNWWQGSLYY